MDVSGKRLPIVLCPLKHEQAALKRAGLAGICDVQCCGPGEAGIRRWFANNDVAGVAGQRVVLAGLAGGLDDSVQAGYAYVVSRVIAAEGHGWRPTWQMPQADGLPSAAIACTAVAITTPEGKRAFAQQTGAALVDLESEAFAEAASSAAYEWTIVRGVSDDGCTALPSGIDGWVDAVGGTRISRVAAAVIARPSLIHDLMALHSASKAALDATGKALKSLLEPVDRA